MNVAKPKLGWSVFALALLVRIWALPFIVLAWVMGTVCAAASFGFALAWELPEFAWSARLRRGPASKKPLPYIDSDDLDEYEDDA